ncbi:MAG: hypothetical protein AMJ78_09735 [Omnitrophica WOR_2 bacterium SM23_29]|nr:MAG: hypothetical protein AMJ78_09735 [Omnitrophica WOR_2 bacterium SM23_29]
MLDENLIKKWIKDGIITEEQARKMLADVAESKKEQSSNKLITFISTIGAISLGIGAILFVASNWQVMPNIIKVLFLLGITLGVYYIGYIFKYQKQNLPKVGVALIFLGALLFGSTVFLVAQIYHINANSHTLILIWLLGILPLVYALKTIPIAALSSLLFYVWMALFVFRNFSFTEACGDFFYLPVLYLIGGILQFGIGGLHYLSEDFKAIARTYRIAGIKISMLALFLLTFRFFSGSYNGFNIRAGIEVSKQFSTGLIIFAILALAITVINRLLNPSKSDTLKLESGASLVLLVMAMIFFYVPPTISNIYPFLFNLILTAAIFILIFVGYRREDIRLVNVGIFYLEAFIVVRYFDYFWKLLPRAMFFMVGGIILILGGIFLEKKRRDLKKQFIG